METKTKIKLAGAAAGAAAAAGAVYYFFGSKKSKQHRKDAITWMMKAEKDIVKEAGKLKDAAFNEKNYKAIVSAISEKYKALPKVDAKDLVAFKKTLIGAWKEYKKAHKKAAPHLKRATKKVTRRVRTIAKKAGR